MFTHATGLCEDLIKQNKGESRYSTRETMDGCYYATERIVVDGNFNIVARIESATRTQKADDKVMCGRNIGKMLMGVWERAEEQKPRVSRPAAMPLPDLVKMATGHLIQSTDTAGPPSKGSV
ncbi:hypothetical protein J6590_009126 [Homalodisca vitripennis]|nr:hypothetical protein J6590_009126 [Homalodisca vitripennis]